MRTTCCAGATVAAIFISSLIGTAQAATLRTVAVDPIADDQNDVGCTFREAIDLANAGITSAIGCTAVETGAGVPLTYRIQLPAYTYTLTGAAGNDDNSGGDLDFTNTGVALEIYGSGAAQSIIDGGGVDRVLHLPFETEVTLVGLTIQNGGGVTFGGGIEHRGTLTILDSIIQDNSAVSGGGILSGLDIPSVTPSFSMDGVIVRGNSASDTGGGLYFSTNALATITNSTIEGNSATRRGGGLRMVGSHETTIVSSTIVDNTAAIAGGGVYAEMGTTNIANSTIAGNSARGDGGGLMIGGDAYLTNVTIAFNVADSSNTGNGTGGGLKRIGNAARLQSNLIAKNTNGAGAFDDCNGTFASRGYNLIGVNSGCEITFPGGQPNASDDFVGVAGIPLDPVLLGPFGEPSFYALSATSPAMDKIPEAACVFASGAGGNPLYLNGDPVTEDQRGAPRGALCDIGAFEFFIVAPVDGLVSSEEAGGTAQFEVALPLAPTDDVVIPLTSTNPGEGVSDAADLIFTPANWSDVQTVTVTGQDDDIDDGDIDYAINLGPMSSTDAAYDGISFVDVMLTNLDDDVAGVVVTPTSGLTTSESNGQASFEVVLTSEPIANVVIAVASTDPAEGVPDKGSLTFTAVDWDVPQTVTVTGQNDEVDDDDVPYQITLATPGTTDPSYATIDPDDVALINTDDDMVGVQVAPTAGLTTNEAGGIATFDVVLSSEPLDAVVISISVDDSSEGAVEPDALTFGPQDWDQPQTVTVTGVDDDVDDGDIAFTVVLAAGVSSDPLYQGLDVADVMVTNQDDDVTLPEFMFADGFED